MRRLFRDLSFISFLMLIGTAGASDNGSISFIQAVLQGSFFLVTWGVLLKLADSFEKINNNIKNIQIKGATTNEQSDYSNHN